MAVENLTATNADSSLPVAGHGFAETVKHEVSTIEVSASASVSSTYALHRVPSGAKLLATSKLYWDDMATTGSPTMDVGAEGPSETYDDDSINDGLALSSASTGSVMVKAIENYGKPLYVLAGHTTDPKEIWTIKAKIKDADVTTGGTLTSELYYKL